MNYINKKMVSECFFRIEYLLKFKQMEVKSDSNEFSVKLLNFIFSEVFEKYWRKCLFLLKQLKNADAAENLVRASRELI